MTKKLKSENSSTPEHAETDVFVLINKMQQQLVFLEKKIDILIGQSQEKSFKEKQYSKPSRSFDRPHHSGRYEAKRGQGEDPRGRSFHSGHPFEKRQGGEDRGFGGPKKDYSDDRAKRAGSDRPFKKNYGGKKSGVAPRKTLPFHKRKDQQSSQA